MHFIKNVFAAGLIISTLTFFGGLFVIEHTARALGFELEFRSPVAFYRVHQAGERPSELVRR